MECVIVKYLTLCGSPGSGRAGENAAHGRLLLKTRLCRRTRSRGRRQSGFSRPPKAGFLLKLGPRRPRGRGRRGLLCKISGNLPHSTLIGIFMVLGWNEGSTLNGTFLSLGWSERAFFDKFLTKFLFYSTPTGIFLGFGWNGDSTQNSTFRGLGWSWWRSLLNS